MDNDGGTSDLKAPVFDMEWERSELDTNATETSSSCVDDCCLDDVFSSPGSDVSEDEFPEFHHNHQRLAPMGLRFITMTCVIDAKGIMTNCVPIEQHLPNEDKMKWLESDIAIIGFRLRWFLSYYLLDCHLDNRDQILDQILDQIDFTKKYISKLDDFWNSHYLVTEELNRQINELNHSNTGLCHMNQEVADLYSIYVDTKCRFQCLIIHLKNKLVSFDKREEFSMKLIKWMLFNVPVSRSVTSHSESVTSHSESVTSHSESVTSYSHSNSRSEFRIGDDNTDGYESLFNNDYRLREWIVNTIFMIINILWVANWLGLLQCGDMDNYIERVFEFGLWCINKTKPT